ncbi:anaerobic ribonucleoside-triphosphate reductase [Candidatus Bathyarchaeota archaeon]|nr:anaerobic ribonucleoside-triphosphate reductase [Candidatus Bathyarchaeota archaeon]
MTILVGGSGGAMMVAVKKMPVECYSRIVGYLRPIQNWNKGKLAEFYDRKTYSWGKAVEHASK